MSYRANFERVSYIAATAACVVVSALLVLNVPAYNPEADNFLLGFTAVAVAFSVYTLKNCIAFFKRPDYSIEQDLF
jgi:hypothetical protein